MTGNIVTRGRYRGVRFPKRQIKPRRDNSRMRCGKCSMMDFEVHVRPAKTTIIGAETSAQIAEIICLGCLKSYKFDDQGGLLATGKVDVTSNLDLEHVAPDRTDIEAAQLVRKTKNEP